MKKERKSNKRVVLILSLVMCMFLSTPVFGATLSGTTEVVSKGEPSFARVEETMWYFRTHNGVRQRRLWSITYGHWKTAWMKV